MSVSSSRRDRMLSNARAFRHAQTPHWLRVQDRERQSIAEIKASHERVKRARAARKAKKT